MAPTKKPPEDEGSNEKPKRVEPVELAPMTGVGAYREQVKTKLRRAVPLVVLATGAGLASGKIAQNKYRDVTGFDPDEPIEEASSDLDNDESDEPEDDLDDEDEGRRGYVEKMRRGGKKLLRRAKEAASDNVVTRTYHDIENQWKAFKRFILETGDAIAFWVPFVTVALAFYWISRKIQAAYLRRFHPHDPVIVRNFEALARKTDELRGVANYLLARGAPQDPVAARADLDDLARRVGEIEDALRGPAQALEAGTPTELPPATSEPTTGPEPGKV